MRYFTRYCQSTNAVLQCSLYLSPSSLSLTLSLLSLSPSPSLSNCVGLFFNYNPICTFLSTPPPLSLYFFPVFSVTHVLFSPPHSLVFSSPVFSVTHLSYTLPHSLVSKLNTAGILESQRESGPGGRSPFPRCARSRKCGHDIAKGPTADSQLCLSSASSGGENRHELRGGGLPALSVFCLVWRGEQT